MTLASDRAFPRHSHDQLGIGVIISGAHRSWSGIGHVEAEAGDMIMVNPGEMHDGTPVAGGERAWQMLYFDPLLAAEITNDGDVGSVEMVRAAARDPALTSLFARLFACITAPTADPFLIEERCCAW